eukprot:TRINITY_DN4082_c0_g1_i2.p1 TRINITY_DN4082_c0_g1~~TRINITY_DN4082_c0_g1_i2.p1  ORF type:complete len:446 (+),score=-0.91 TRINITY_DN4082_c0_g1_i2:77-1414(+)
MAAKESRQCQSKCILQLRGIAFSLVCVAFASQLLLVGCLSDVAPGDDQWTNLSFCEKLIAERTSTCPKISTVAKLDISKFQGKWYEIGASAVSKLTKKTGDLGLASVTYTYTLKNKSKTKKTLSLSRDGLVAVIPMRRNQVAAVSAGAFVLARQLRAVCVTMTSLYTRQQLSTAYLTLGSEDFPVFVEQSVSSGLGGIQSAVDDVSKQAERVWYAVEDVQRANAQLNQRDAASLVAQAKRSMRAAMAAIKGAANAMSAARDAMYATAAKNRDVVNGVPQGSLTGREKIAAAMGNVMNECSNSSALSQRLAGLGSAVKALQPLVATLFVSPNPAPFKVKRTRTGVLTQSTSEPGKMIQEFNGVQTDHWVLNVWGDASQHNSHTLVYSCYKPAEGLSSNMDGMATVRLLSRSSTLSEDDTNEALQYMENQGVVLGGDNPFVPTEQKY